MKKKILVAGGTGYIGSHTTVELQNAGYEVVIIDDLSNSNIEVLDGIEKITGIRPEFIQLDLKDKEGTRKALEAHPGIKGIILFAASKAVGESVQQPLKYYRNNIVTLVNLLEMMPEFNIEGIVFSSSCTVYGQPDPKNLPVTENAPIKPAMSPYGNTKQINEEIIRDTIHAGATEALLAVAAGAAVEAAEEVEAAVELLEPPHAVKAAVAAAAPTTVRKLRREIFFMVNFLLDSCVLVLFILGAFPRHKNRSYQKVRMRSMQVA